MWNSLRFEHLYLRAMSAERVSLWCADLIVIMFTFCHSICDSEWQQTEFPLLDRLDGGCVLSLRGHLLVSS